MKISSCQKTKKNDLQLMEAFTNYLKTKALANSSIEGYVLTAGRFLKWVEKESLKAEQVSYQDVLLYMKHCQKQQIKQGTIQGYLLCIKHYYDHLLAQQSINQNPVEGIAVKGVKRKQLYHIFGPHELNGFYNSCPAPTFAGKRNKVMLGLLVYQGLKTEELIRLETDNVKLREGKIEILATHKGSNRVLQLEPHQVMDLYDYMLQTRAAILKLSKEETNKLFVAQRGGNYLSNQVQEIARWLRAQNKQFMNVRQLRASVIVKWLKQYNLREVQYMAGHRYISSTEQYLQNDVEGLQEEVNQFHPLG